MISSEGRYDFGWLTTRVHQQQLYFFGVCLPTSLHAALLVLWHPNSWILFHPRPSQLSGTGIFFEVHFVGLAPYTNKYSNTSRNASVCGTRYESAESFGYRCWSRRQILATARSRSIWWSSTSSLDIHLQFYLFRWLRPLSKFVCRESVLPKLRNSQRSSFQV